MPHRSNGKTFLLCVGAHKAGTTWLHRYLEQHKNVEMGFLKEYHFFDALLSPDKEGTFKKYIELARGRIDQIERQLNSPAPLRKNSIRENIFKMMDFFVDYDNYFDYFTRTLFSNPDTLLTGDITPAYSSLDTSVFELINSGFRSRGVTVRVIFLMRDPVDRCISACQFNLSQRRLGNQSRTFREVDFDRYVRKNSRAEGFQSRGRYDLTIENLEAAFDKDQIHYEFYETLFNDQSVTRICRFLDIEPMEANFEERVNESKLKYDASDEVKSEVRALYAPVYDFIYERYPKSFIDSIWASS